MKAEPEVSQLEFTRTNRMGAEAMPPQKQPESWAEAIQQYHRERRGGNTPPPLEPMNRWVAVFIRPARIAAGLQRASKGVRAETVLMRGSGADTH